MLFIDLNKLRVVKDYRFQTYEIELSLGSTTAAAKMLAQLREACRTLCADTPAIAASYVINIDIPNIDEATFVTIVNLAAIAFFDAQVQNGGRARERRLDIPESLHGVHVSAAQLKRAINALTKVNVFNLTVNCGDLHYMMVDTKENVHE